MFRLEGIDHVALAVRDVARSAEWYQSVLGLTRRHEEIWGDAPAMVGVGSTSVALFAVDAGVPPRRPGETSLTMLHLAFRVDAENFAAAQRDLGAKRIAFEFQDHGISRSIYLHDPDGHENEITTYDLER